MAQNITIGYRGLMDAAESEIENLTVQEGKRLLGRDDVVFVTQRN